MQKKQNRKIKKSIFKFFDNKFSDSEKYIRWCLLAGVTIIFILILYPGLAITKHSYKSGDVAERDIKASKDFFVEDKEATQINRRQAVEKLLTVYDHDTTLSLKLSQHVKQAFDDLEAVFESEKQKVSSTGTVEKNSSVHDRIWQLKKNFEEEIGITVSQGAYSVLEKEEFSNDVANLICVILKQILENGVVANKEILLGKNDKGIFLIDLETKSEQVIHNLRQFYGLDQAKTMVRIIGQPILKNLNYNLRNLIVDFVQSLIQPNITLNKNETEKRKKRALSKIKSVLYKVKAGEMLLREGERVRDVQLLKLQAWQTQTKKGQILESSIGAVMIILSLFIITYILYINHQDQFARDHNKNLLFLSCILITFLLIAGISAPLSEILIQNRSFSISASSLYFGIPIASGAMIVCLFMGVEIATAFAIVLAVCTTVIFQNKFEIFIYFMLNSTMAAYWIQDCRERKVFIKAGVKLGFLNMLLATSINFYITDFSGFKLLWDWIFAFMGGIGTGIVAAGIAPIVEIAFNYTTHIKLLELANLDQPILRRLMIEAPGSYHHSVIAGSMVEAAASEIGANSLLAKVCGYYHDIGKIKKPLYFIENQTNGKNKHNKLAPSMSSLILIAHVKDGVEIARENKLGQAIIDTIRQHHGTSLISFFYEKAKKLKGEDAVNIDNFRYPGPKPQTREAGLVMLADVVEAASRTLDNPTPSRIQGLVQNLVNKIFSDGQLDECELTLKDLHKIAKSFNKTLNGIYHNRIEYPEKLVLINGKKKNGSLDKQQTKQAETISEKNRANGQGHLKRLGLS